MAATSTNKQPLLVDHVLHEVVDLAGATVAQGGGVDIGGTNNAVLVVDSTQADGCIIESIYALARQSASTYTIKLYLSRANDYLRAQQGTYIGQFQGGNTNGEVTYYPNLPFILAPVPATGDSGQFQALYIPKGKALWAAVEAQTASDQATTAPLLGVQGGWY
jgi:hypothetical protein